MTKLYTILSLALLSLSACGGDSDGGSTAGTGGASAGSGGASAGSGGASAGSGGASAGSGGASAGSGGASAGSGGASAGTGGASAGSGGASAGSGGATTACNTLSNDGGDIPEKAETGTAPAMTGGTVADGTYVLTSRSDWMGSCGCTTRQKLQITGDTVQGVTRTDTKADTHFTAKATFTGTSFATGRPLRAMTISASAPLSTCCTSLESCVLASSMFTVGMELGLG